VSRLAFIARLGNGGITVLMRAQHHIRIRFVLLVAVGVTAVCVGAGIAFARGKATPIGTGVVVIDTNLAYEDGAAAGTGMVLTSSGTVLTNNHVISGATSIKVVVPGTGYSYTATVAGYDRTQDVAVLRLRGASNLKTVSAGDSSSLRVGQAVRALGNAGGTGSLVSARGTVTGLGKSITASDDEGSSERLTGLIETNAGVQPGDSGGPLLDSAGRVVGMDTAASSSDSPYASEASDAYAIPIAHALAIAAEIEANESSATVHVGGTAFLGVQVEATGSGYGETSGALIAGVVSGGPASRAGLEAGDVITALDGRRITSPATVAAVILAKKPGATVTLTYLDQVGNPYTVRVTLGSGPAQ
jgi:S1-C subfamily serine protease